MPPAHRPRLSRAATAGRSFRWARRSFRGEGALQRGPTQCWPSRCCRCHSRAETPSPAPPGPQRRQLPRGRIEPACQTAGKPLCCPGGRVQTSAAGRAAQFARCLWSSGDGRQTASTNPVHGQAPSSAARPRGTPATEAVAHLEPCFASGVLRARVGVACWKREFVRRVRQQLVVAAPPASAAEPPGGHGGPAGLLEWFGRASLSSCTPADPVALQYLATGLLPKPPVTSAHRLSFCARLCRFPVHAGKLRLVEQLCRAVAWARSPSLCLDACNGQQALARLGAVASRAPRDSRTHFNGVVGVRYCPARAD